MTSKIEFHKGCIVVEQETYPCEYGYVRGADISIDSKDSVSIETGRDILPRDLFFVASDHYPNDKSVKDYSKIHPDHPLYKYVRYAAAKSRETFLLERLADYKPIPCIADSPETIQRDLDRLQEVLTEDPGQPATEDLTATRAYLNPPDPHAEERAANRAVIDRMINSVFRKQ